MAQPPIHQLGREGFKSFSQAQARPINPEHLRQIIDTSDSRTLRKVLINLCELSPALSAAVARGLAPHSTFAQGVIDRKRAMSHMHTAKSTRDDDINGAYERLKARFASTKVSILPQRPSYEHHAQTPRPTRHIDQVGKESTNGPIKSESDDDGGNDDEIHLPSSHTRSVHRASAIQTPLPKLSGRSTVNDRTLGSVQDANGSSRVKQERNANTTPKVCSQCHELFSGDSEVCMYHTGEKTEQEDGQIVYSCCQQSFNDLGCQFGSHASDSESGQESQDLSQRKRPSATPTPYSAQRKITRLL